MGNHIGFVYVILQCFDQNVLRSWLCRLTILQFIVVPPHSTVEGHIFLFFLNLGVKTFFVFLQIKINACSIIMGTSNLTSVSHSNNTNSLILYRSALYPQSSLYHSVYEHWCTGNAHFHICKCARSFGS